jgi:hypothetical protein
MVVHCQFTLEEESMKSQMTRMVGILALLVSLCTFTACGDKSMTQPPSTEATIESATTTSPNAGGNTGSGSEGTTPNNPNPPAPPAPPTPPPPGGPEDPVEQPRVGPCEVPAHLWDLRYFNAEQAKLVVKNNGSCTDYYGAALFKGTAENEETIRAQVRVGGKIVPVKPGEELTITWEPPPAGDAAACYPTQTDVIRHMAVLPDSATLNSFGPGGMYLVKAEHLDSSFTFCPKTCPEVEPFLGELRVEDAGDSVNVSVIPDFKSVTNNANNLVIEVVLKDGDGVAIRQTRITRDQKGVRVPLGNFSKGSSATTYTVRFKVSDDQVQNCVSNELTFTVPAKPAVNVCVGTSGQLIQSSPATSADAVRYSLTAKVTGGATAYLITSQKPIFAVGDGHVENVSVQRPEPGSGSKTETAILIWKKGDEECGRDTKTATIPEKDKKLVCVDLNHRLVASLNLSTDGKSAQVMAKSEWTGGPTTSTITFDGASPQQYTRGGVQLTSPVYPRKAEPYTVSVKSHVAIEGGNCDTVQVFTIPALEVPEPTCPSLNLELTIVNVEYPVNMPDKAIVTVRLNWTGGQDAGTVTRDNVESKPIIRGGTASFTVDRLAQPSEVNFRGEAKLPNGTMCPVTKKATINPKELTCAEQYPPRLDSATGYAEMQGNKTVVKAQFFAQNVTGRTVAIIWNNTWPKAVVDVRQACAAGQFVPIIFESMEGGHSQASGSRYEVWEVVPGAQPLNGNFTKIGNAPLAVLNWR